MITRRLVVTLALVALVSNCVVLAKPNSSGARPSAGQAFTLMSLRHETASGLTRILIESNSPPLYTVFRPTDHLIQVDLPGGEGSQLAPEYAVKSDMVDSIQVHKGRSVGQSLRAATRIDIALQLGVSDHSRVEGNTLVIELAADQSVARKAVKTGAQSDPQPSEKPGVYVHPVPVNSNARKSAPAAPEAPTQAATVVRAVRHESSGEGVRIVIDTDGAAEFKDFVLSNPWRIVVDITGVRLASGNKSAAIGAASVERIRVGQPAANVVRIVLDTATKTPYRVERLGTQLVIVVGNQTSTNMLNPSSQPESKEVAQKPEDAKPAPEVKVAGERVINTQSEKAESSTKSALPSTEIAQAAKPATSQPNAAKPATSQPASRSGALKESVTQPITQPAGKTVAELQRGSQPAPASSTVASSRPAASYKSQSARSDKAFCDPSYVGGPISFDLRAGVDLRDMLRFVSQQYGVNFIVDKSVTAVPVDIRVTDIPWNQVIEAVLRANRLGAVCESGGRLIRIATLAAVKEEEDARLAIKQAEDLKTPLETKVIRLRYARATGVLGGGSSRSGGGGGGVSIGGGGGGNQQGTGNLLSIAKARLSQRGKIEVDGRTNTLIVIDLPDNVREVENIISQLDRPDPQVEIEARIVIASRNFLRDVGNELAAAARDINQGKTGLFSTSPITLGDGGVTSGQTGGGGGGGGGGNQGLGTNLVGPLVNPALRASASSVLSLTTGLIGTSIISSALSLSETKGQIRTIASPRITAQDQQTAEIVNGVQIPVQTVSNNTVTTTFVTAALRLEITPQIIEDTGEVLMRVVAENNTVNTALASGANGGTPGINTQAAQSIVRVQDGGTTVMGGINIDTEGHSISRTPGVSSLPLIGELFKRRTTRRDYDEILFFITPRIVRNDGIVGPGLRRSSVDGAPAGSSAPQRAATTPSPNVNNNTKAEKSAQPSTAPSGKGGGK